MIKGEPEKRQLERGIYKDDSSRVYVARTVHLQERLSVEALGHQFTHKLQLTVCLTYEMCWGNGGTEIVAVA